MQRVIIKVIITSIYNNPTHFKMILIQNCIFYNDTQNSFLEKGNLVKFKIVKLQIPMSVFVNPQKIERANLYQRKERKKWKCCITENFRIIHFIFSNI